MAWPDDIDVKDAGGVTRAGMKAPNANGRAAAADSRPTVWANEDLAAIGSLTETAPASDTASSGLNGRLQRIAQRITSLIALFPASLGAKAASASLAVTQSTEDAARIGATNETAATSDTATAGLNGLLKRIAQRISSLITSVTDGSLRGTVIIDQTTPGTTNAMVLKTSGGTEVNFADATAGAMTQVASSATAVTILAANTSRKFATVFNDSTQVLYLGVSATDPTSSLYSVKVAAGGFVRISEYTGAIKGIWASANGAAQVTENT